MGYEVIQMDETSWRICDNGTVQIFLFVGTEKALLVDTGYGKGDLRGLVENITKLPIMLVNTHGDWDHISGNKQFEEAYLHRDDFDRYRLVEGDDTPLKALRDGEMIDIGGRCFEVIWIPGHTKGSIVLLDIENRILVSGDSAQSGTILMFGANRDIDQYIESLKKLNGMRERFDIIYPSHGPFPVKVDVIEQLIDKVEQVRDGKIESIDDPRRPGAKIYNIGVASFVFI